MSFKEVASYYIVVSNITRKMGESPTSLLSHPNWIDVLFIKACCPEQIQMTNLGLY